ncbi:MAG: cupredoxin domain-containing protein [Acidimicrobiales bacterium]
MRKLLTSLAAATLLFAACGDDDGGDVRETGSGSESGSGSGTGDQGEVPVELEGTVENHGTGEVESGGVEVELDDFYFGPTFVKASPGEEVTLTLFNEGDANHTFTSGALDVDEELAPGDETEVTVTLPDDGATAFFCRFHQGRGMQGAFFFEEGDTVQGITGTSGSDPGGIYGG